MSKYTTEVRYICEVNAGLNYSEGYNSINDILDNCVDKVFDFPFPIFDEAYRPVIEKKILKHYYTREIGTETVGLWKHFLDMKMNEIMPYYNQLYKTQLLEFNPLYEVDLYTEHTKQGDSNSVQNTANTGTISDDGEESFTRTDALKRTSQDSGTEGDSGSVVNKNVRWDIYSDTPQGALTNVNNESYLTNARKITDDGTGSTNTNTKTFGKKVVTDDTGTQTNVGTKENTRTLDTRTNSSGNISTTEDYLQHVWGKTPGASYSKLLKEYRETFLNIDMMIINELKDLFFNLW